MYRLAENTQVEGNLREYKSQSNGWNSLIVAKWMLEIQFQVVHLNKRKKTHQSFTLWFYLRLSEDQHLFVEN